MKILVLSDSHSTLSFMRRCIDTVKPDVMIHLGDHYDDAEAMAEEYPGIRLYQVPGNCDRYRVPPHVSEILITRVFGVDLYMTHGHKHRVKSTMGLLTAAARVARVQAVLYGHTHIPDCRKEGDLWILNPGSSGSWGGSAGIIFVENGKIIGCRNYRYGDQEEKA